MKWLFRVCHLLFPRHEVPRQPVNDDGPIAGQIAPEELLSVPFAYDWEETLSAPRIAVMLHAFHLDELPPILRSLGIIPYEVTLAVSTDTQEKKSAIEALLAGGRFKIRDIRIVPNRGRDIAPRFVEFADVYGKHEFVLHIHTKKSLHEPLLSDWLPQMSANILGSKKAVRSIFEAFRTEPRLGVIAPRYHGIILPWIMWAENYQRCADLGSRMGVHLKKSDHCAFPAGSVFWARTAALKPLLDLKVAQDDFEPEAGQIDDTLAHAIERMIFISAEVAGFMWCFAADTDAPEDGQVHGVPVTSHADLVRRLQAVKTRVLSQYGTVSV